MRRMQLPDRAILQRRLRALVIVLSLLVPAFCVIGGLALALASQQPGVVAYMLLAHWVLVGAAIGLLVWRAQRTLEALARAREEPSSSNPDEPAARI